MASWTSSAVIGACLISLVAGKVSIEGSQKLNLLRAGQGTLSKKTNLLRNMSRDESSVWMGLFQTVASTQGCSVSELPEYISNKGRRKFVGTSTLRSLGGANSGSSIYMTQAPQNQHGPFTTYIVKNEKEESLKKFPGFKTGSYKSRLAGGSSIMRIDKAIRFTGKSCPKALKEMKGKPAVWTFARHTASSLVHGSMDASKLLEFDIKQSSRKVKGGQHSSAMTKGKQALRFKMTEQEGVAAMFKQGRLESPRGKIADFTYLVLKNQCEIVSMPTENFVGDFLKDLFSLGYWDVVDYSVLVHMAPWNKAYLQQKDVMKLKCHGQEFGMTMGIIDFAEPFNLKRQLESKMGIVTDEKKNLYNECKFSNYARNVRRLFGFLLQTLQHSSMAKPHFDQEWYGHQNSKENWATVLRNNETLWTNLNAINKKYNNDVQVNTSWSHFQLNRVKTPMEMEKERLDRLTTSPNGQWKLIKEGVHLKLIKGSMLKKGFQTPEHVMVNTKYRQFMRNGVFHSNWPALVADILKEFKRIAPSKQVPVQRQFMAGKYAQG